MPLLWLSLAFVAGVVLAANLRLPGLAWLGLAAAALFLALLSHIQRRRREGLPPARFGFLFPPVSYALIPLFLFLGAARYQFAQPDLSDPRQLAFYNDRGEPVAVRGMLVEPPDLRETYANLKLHAEAIRLAGEADFRPAEGLLLARSYAPGQWRYGDLLLAEGTLATPAEEEGFSYRDYLAQQRIYSLMTNAQLSTAATGGGSFFWRSIYAFKGRALDTVYRLWPAPEAPLLAGILLGVEGAIPEEVTEAFQDTGTSHVIAISGFNITIVAGLFALLFSRALGRVKGAILALVGIVLYTLLVGAGPSVVRAALMGGITLFAYHLGRRQAGLLSLALVAAVMALINPLVLWSTSFRLSVAATLGLLLFAEPLARGFESLAGRFLPPLIAERLRGPVSEYLLFSLAAGLVTLPVILYHFQRVSLISLLANPAILPVQPAVMVLGGLAVLLGMVYLPLGQLLAWVTWPFAAYTIRAVEFFAGLPFSAYEVGDVSLLAVVAMYAALFGLTFAWSRYKGVAPHIKWGVACTALLALTMLVWQTALAAPDGRLHLTLLDSGYRQRAGDTLLIQTPGGRQVLVNGGPSPSQLLDALSRRLPPLRRRLDYLVVAYPVTEQVEGLLRGVEMFPPEQVLWAGQRAASDEAGYLIQALSEGGVPVNQAQTGQVLDLGEGARLRVLAVGERGAVFLLEWGSFRAVLPIGANFEEYEELEYGRSLGRVSALLLADQGYAASNPREWIANLRPQVVLLSVAAGDREGRPDAEMLEAMQGCPLLRTDQNGWIELSTDGHQMWVEVERR